MVDAHVGGGPLSAAAAMDPRGAVFYRRHAAKFQSDARLSFSAWVAEPALAETDCVAGHIGLEPANPGASYLIGFA